MDKESQAARLNQPPPPRGEARSISKVVFHNTKENEEPPRGEQVYVYFRSERHLATFDPKTRTWHLAKARQVIPETAAGPWSFISHQSHDRRGFVDIVRQVPQ
jgi:hypothetical protein